MKNTFKAVKMDGTDRYMVVDIVTGDVLSDAAGYGFKSKTAACRSYAHYLSQQRKDKVAAIKKTCKVEEMENGRYRVVDSETGSVLSDASGHGFKSKTTAYRSYAYYQGHVATV